MSDYDNELRGAMFKNRDKQAGDTKPDYTGSATIEGVDYFLDAWINDAKSGAGKYLSVKFKRKDKQRSAPPAPRGERPKDEAYRAASSPSSRRPSPAYDDDSDVPF